MSSTSKARRGSQTTPGATAPSRRTLADALQELERERREKAELLVENGRLRAQQRVTIAGLAVLGAPPADGTDVLARVLETAKALCDARAGSVLRVAGDQLVLEAVFGQDGLLVGPQITERLATAGPALTGPWARSPEYPHWRAALERRVVHVPDVTALRSKHDGAAAWIAVARERGLITHLYVPLRRGDEVVGVVGLFRGEPARPAGGSGVVRPFSEAEIAAAETLAAQVVIALENARLFQELNESNATLTEALEQQTATAEVLQVISRSPADLQTVLDTICDSAARLCAVDSGVIIWRLDGDHFWAAAGTGLDGERPTLAVPMYRNRVSRGHPVGRAMVDRTVVHVEDLAAVPLDEMPAPVTRAVGIRTMLGVPLLRDGEVFGGISLARREPRPFTEKQIRLVHTFADQTVIAIENARLFTELQQRDERRRQELERASAIQQRLLPSFVEGWRRLLEVAVRFRAAVETSGDFYDVLTLPAAEQGALEPLQIAVGDVAGKGMAAALVTALARSALHASASMPTAAVTPAGTLRVAGQRLHRDVGSGHFVACALAIVEPPNLLHAGPRLTVSNAAQVPVLLVRGGEAREIEPPGDRLPLGARPDGDYEDAKVELIPGDVVVFSSDGLVEAPSLAAMSVSNHLPPPESEGELFGFARLAAAASHWALRAGSAEAVAAGIWSDLTSWCGDQSHHDDMTLLVLHVSH